ncbi:MAG: hypothetical protein AB7G25_02850 [Sphingomonadaceae bacterium]
MDIKDKALENLTIHTACSVHLITKWLAGRPDVDQELRSRLSVHLSGIEGAMSAGGHQWIAGEMHRTEGDLRLGDN